MENNIKEDLIALTNEQAKKINAEIIERFTGKDGKAKLKIRSLSYPEKGVRVVDRYNFLHSTAQYRYFNAVTCKNDLLRHEEITSRIDIIGDYINTATKILCKCKICSNEWMVTPNKLLQGRGCPKCASQKAHRAYSKSHEEFINELKNVNPSITILDEYYNNRTKIRYKCNICNKVSMSTPCKLLDGESGCHFCKSSIGEQKIFCFLFAHKVPFEREKYFEDCKDKGKLPFDFYLSDYNICIEFQGEQHFRPVDFSYTPTEESKNKAVEKFKGIQKRDKIKAEYCKQNGIRLLIIDYKQIKNIESILTKELNLSTVTTAGSLW
jgi:hypothetical protein